jgi:uncharacterized membrane protein (DUF373 family)
MTRGSEPRTSHTEIHRLSRRFLEPAQDLLVLGLGLALFGLMARTLVGLLREVLASSIDFRTVIAEVLFMLVMVELMRLLVIYLEEHRVAVDFMVELGIVSTLREVVCATTAARTLTSRHVTWWPDSGVTPRMLPKLLEVKDGASEPDVLRVGQTQGCSLDAAGRGDRICLHGRTQNGTPAVVCKRAALRVREKRDGARGCL